jgi:predicted aconitase
MGLAVLCHKSVIDKNVSTKKLAIYAFVVYRCSCQFSCVPFTQGNQQNAQSHLAIAESIHPELDIVKVVKAQMQV